MKRILFICTGNYYRSRFAEALFNAIAIERALPWRATSRGTDIEGAGRYNIGPISAVARQALEARGLSVEVDVRFPIQIAEHDLRAAHLVIAVCEAEHRPWIERAFPSGAERVEYWRVQDLGDTPADEAIAALERHVLDLIERLSESA